MSSLKLSDGCTSSFDSLKASENFLEELSDNELAIINGGIVPVVAGLVIKKSALKLGGAFGLGYAIGKGSSGGGATNIHIHASTAQK